LDNIKACEDEVDLNLIKIWRGENPTDEAQAFYEPRDIEINNNGNVYILETIDLNGVGEMMKMAVEKGRKTRPNLKIGICGVHGGEPRSIFFCHKIGLDYVSCSAYQVPIARLAAAQVAVIEKRKIEISGD
jgi:hypothetical protein